MPTGDGWSLVQGTSCHVDDGIPRSRGSGYETHTERRYALPCQSHTAKISKGGWARLRYFWKRQDRETNDSQALSYHACRAAKSSYRKPGCHSFNCHLTNEAVEISRNLTIPLSRIPPERKLNPFGLLPLLCKYASCSVTSSSCNSAVKPAMSSRIETVLGISQNRLAYGKPKSDGHEHTQCRDCIGTFRLEPLSLASSDTAQWPAKSSSFYTISD